ncbi:MAG TPA: fumarylacetoacetate hydrolase family protein [Bryobacteraceae bacterium]|nr:fumarylacetoacetate hydrolase family protein [Bryobacteraceae bacterium]
MRFLRFVHPSNEIHLALRRGDEVVDLTAAARRFTGRELLSVTSLPHEDSLASVRALADSAASNPDLVFQYQNLRLDAPIRDVPKLLALAGNFRKHIVESGFREVEREERITPQVFCKPPSTTLNGPDGLIPLRASNVFLDWEVELAVIIGKRGRDISAEDALSHAFGYTVINDISERQFNGGMKERNVREFDPFFDWLLGKWFDGSAPLGPEIVTADEITNPHQLNLQLSLNGEVMQSSNTSQMIFDIPQTIAYISSVLTLEPGDVIAMGTPDGVGKARGIRLQPGDRMRAEIEGIGALETRIAGE